MDMTITPQKITEQNEFQITLLKTFEFTSYVMGNHVHKDRWIPVKVEVLKAVVQPKNKEDKFAVAITIVWPDIYQKKNWKIYKNYFVLSTSL